MKNSIFCTLALLAFCLQLSAQPQGSIWVGSRSSNANANAVHAALTNALDAFVAGNYEKGWASYTQEAAAISPDGKIAFGKTALYDLIDPPAKMAGEGPKFKYSNAQVRMLTNDVALAVWDAESDNNGQQIGAKGMAVLHKINGQWKIEFDQQTPMFGMPALDAGSKD